MRNSTALDMCKVTACNHSRSRRAIQHRGLWHGECSDHRHDVGKRYSSYNDTYAINKRTVYVIDKTGKIAYIDLRYSPRDSVSFVKLRSALTTLK